MLEEMSNRYGNVHPTAKEMADLFEQHAIYFGGAAHLSEDGWQFISEMYGDVLPEMRMSVFSDFMKELTRRGIDYDKETFQSASIG